MLGAQVATDPLIYKVTDHPTRNPYVQVSDDGHYLVLWIYDGSQQTGIYYQRLANDGSPEGEVSTVKMDGSGWSNEIDPIVLNLRRSYLYGA